MGYTMVVFNHIYGLESQIKLMEKVGNEELLEKVSLEDAMKIMAMIESLERKLVAFEEKMKCFSQEIPKAIAEEVSSNIVGESYYNYDSSKTFFPTIFLIFKEIDSTQLKRKSQVKARLKINNEGVSDEYLRALRGKCEDLKELHYKYGSLRANYVSSDKRWKTTVFARDEETAELLLKAICDLADEPFSTRNISFTYGRERENPFRRKGPLDGVEPNLLKELGSPTMKIHRIILQVNGIPRPILLFRNSF